MTIYVAKPRSVEAFCVTGKMLGEGDLGDIPMWIKRGIDRGDIRPFQCIAECGGYGVSVRYHTDRWIDVWAGSWIVFDDFQYDVLSDSSFRDRYEPAPGGE